jgi:hypothetical protein
MARLEAEALKEFPPLVRSLLILQSLIVAPVDFVFGSIISFLMRGKDDDGTPPAGSGI